MTGPATPGKSKPTAPSAGHQSGRRRVFRWLEWFSDHPLMKVTVVVITLAGAIIWLVNVVSDDDADRATGSPGTTTTVQGSPDPRSTPHRSASSPTPSSGPMCWDSHRDLVDCREDHRLEEIAPATCDQAAVIAFLGGLSSLDVTVARAAKAPSGGCAVDATRDVRGSARDVLRGEAAAGWRRCVDRRVQKNLPCSELHSGEYLSTGKTGRATDAECRAAAAEYLDQDPANVADDLQVRPLDVRSGTPDPARCIVDARGNHLLTTSVRNLGQRPVPIFSG